MTPSLVADIRAALADAADPAKAPQMQAYMKSALPYAGVPAPVLKRLGRRVFAAHPVPDADTLDDAVRTLFDGAQVREEWYLAIQLAGLPAYSAAQTPRRWPLYRHLITAGAWWDICDPVATRLVGPILRAYDETMRPVLQECATDPDLWLRRTAIIAQLHASAGTDLDLLTLAVDANLDDKDFFVRKAIGWALRQHARTDPGWVRRFVLDREDRLSGLSKREALKHL